METKMEMKMVAYCSPVDSRIVPYRGFKCCKWCILFSASFQ